MEEFKKVMKQRDDAERRLKDAERKLEIQKANVKMDSQKIEELTLKIQELRNKLFDVVADISVYIYGHEEYGEFITDDIEMYMTIDAIDFDNEVNDYSAKMILNKLKKLDFKSGYINFKEYDGPALIREWEEDFEKDEFITQIKKLLGDWY